jgi:hypothetical protein
MTSTPTPPRFAVATIVGTCVTVTLSSCGYDGGAKNTPESNRDSAQSVVESFVGLYNGEGFGEAVRSTFCPPNVAGNENLSAPAGAAYAPDSMTLTSPASVSGSSGRSVVTVAAPNTAPVFFSVALTKDKVQGWCVVGLSASTAGTGATPDA